IIDKVSLESNEAGSTLQVFAASKEDLQACLDANSGAGIDAKIITPQARALAHFSKLFFSGKPPHNIIDITSSETTLVLVSSGKPLQARSHPTGLSSLTVNEESIGELHGYLRELARILLSFEGGDALPILFTGTITEQPELLKLISTFLQR